MQIEFKRLRGPVFGVREGGRGRGGERGEGGRESKTHPPEPYLHLWPLMDLESTKMSIGTFNFLPRAKG